MVLKHIEDIFSLTVIIFYTLGGYSFKHFRCLEEYQWTIK